MITIDLLPAEDVRAAAAVRRARAVAIGIAVTAGLALLVGHVALEAATSFSRRRLIRTDAELAALERPVAALRRLRQRQAALRRRLGVIAGLEARRGGPVPLLDALAAAASPQLSLIDVALVDERMRLTGIAVDDQTIADFLARLRATGALSALDLEEAGRDDRAPHARRFVVTGRVGGGR
jgi:type IV pilus assembly protein PilN